LTGGLQQFTRGIDWSGASLGATDLTADGTYVFAGRYTAGAGTDDPHTAWKLATKAEASDLIAADVDLFLFSEWYAGRVTEGYLAGLADGARDYQQAKDLGLPSGTGLVPSWDEGQPNAALHPRLASYLKGYRRACGYRPRSGTPGFYTVGLYAGDVAIRAMRDLHLADFGVRAEAENWSQDAPAGASWFRPGGQWQAAAQAVARVSPANAWQNGNVAFLLDGGADEEVILSEWTYGAISSQGKLPNPKPPVPVPVPKPVPQPELVEYRVRPGDTLSGLAARRDTTTRQLVRWNRSIHPSLGVDPDILRVDWKLWVPRRHHVVADHIYEVRRGDTLWLIARRHHTTVTQLIAWNSRFHPHLGQHPDRISEGLRLRVN
jgi:LysM repeat protein